MISFWNDKKGQNSPKKVESGNAAKTAMGTDCLRSSCNALFFWPFCASKIAKNYAKMPVVVVVAFNVTIERKKMKTVLAWPPLGSSGLFSCQETLFLFCFTGLLKAKAFYMVTLFYFKSCLYLFRRWPGIVRVDLFIFACLCVLSNCFVIWPFHSPDNFTCLKLLNKAKRFENYVRRKNVYNRG